MSDWMGGAILTLTSSSVMRSFASFSNSCSSNLTTRYPSEGRSRGCRPPVGRRSRPIVASTSQSLLQMSLYSTHSLPSGLVKGVRPKRRQYNVTPSAHISIAFVIGGRRDDGEDWVCTVDSEQAWAVLVDVARLMVLDEEAMGEGSVLGSNTTSGARKEGVPAVLDRSESSRRIGSCGFSRASSPRPAAARRCA